MRKILVYLAHPQIERSLIHAYLIKMLQEHPAVTFVDLYREYPDFNINVHHEQNRLNAHDAIIFEHPVYWYSTPPILKEWQDRVLQYGFAYGKSGDKLRGKAFGQVVSAGSSEEAYTRRGSKGFTLRELFAPMEATARLCGMIYLPPLAIYSAGTASEEGRFDGFKLAYHAYLDALADPEIGFTDVNKRDDLITTIRNFMRV